MLAKLKIRNAAVRYALRATLASWIALSIAFLLKLDSPQWAAVTVWIVAQPSRGMTLSKGFYRLIGTVVGALVAVVLIYFFAQQPFVFVLLLALWVAFSTYVASLVRYFRSYGAVLAGYTASIVGLLVYRQPENVFEVARARVMCVLLGIVVTMFVASLLSKSKLKDELVQKLRNVLARVIEFPPMIFANVPRTESSNHERRLLINLREIDELATYAAAESLQVRMRTRAIYSLIGSAFSVLSTTRSLDLQLTSESAGAAHLTPELTELSRVLTRIAQELRSGVAVSTAELQDLKKQLAPEKKGGPALEVFERLTDLISGIENTLRGHEGWIQRPHQSQATTRFTFHKDLKIARIVALRTFTAVASAGLIWQFTGWRNGALMLMMTAVYCGIFATHNNPVAGLMTALKSSVLAATGAFFCHLFLLSPATPTPVLFLVMALFLFPGAFFTADPKHSTAGMLYNAFFLLFLGSVHPVAFEMTAFGNTVLGFFSSIIVTYLTFRLVLPTNPDRRLKSLARDMISDLEAAARASVDFSSVEFETRMFNRASQLIQISVEAPEKASAHIEGALAAIDLGREILRLRNLLLVQGPQRGLSVTAYEAVSVSLRELGQLSLDPEDTIRSVTAAAGKIRGSLTKLDANYSSDRRAAASLDDICAVLTHQKQFIF